MLEGYPQEKELIMNEYETVLVLKPDLPVASISKVKDKVQKVLADHNAKMDVNRDWGKRKLAYNIQHQSFGHYLYFGYQGQGGVVHDLEKTIGFDENVLRFLTVKFDPFDRKSSQGAPVKTLDPEEMQMAYDDSSSYRSHSSYRAESHQKTNTHRQGENNAEEDAEG